MLRISDSHNGGKSYRDRARIGHQLGEGKYNYLPTGTSISDVSGPAWSFATEVVSAAINQYQLRISGEEASYPKFFSLIEASLILDCDRPSG